VTEDMEGIAEEVAERVVNRLLLAMGVNATDPEELINFQKDFAHLRGWRESMEMVKRRGLAAAVGFLVTGSLGYLLFLFTRH
jgi:hypothetical protein